MRPSTRAVPALLAALLLAPAAAGVRAAGPHPATPAGAACATGQCHAAFGIALAAAPSVHEPAAGGECGACHDLALPAGAAFVKGAPAAVPGVPRQEGGAWEVRLCGGCHEEKFAAGEGAGSGTAFLEGERNLHRVHVRASGKGRACLACHDPHAAPQARLLRDRIPARGTTIAQKFESRPRGGWCRTGCHAPKTYTRE